MPAYGGGGTGELVRCRVLAQALLRERPAVRIEFVLPAGEAERRDLTFPQHVHQGTARDKWRFDNQCIAALRPDIVVFDSGCRSASLRLCRRLRVVSAYLSDRAGACRKAFRPDWLWLLDQHWHLREDLLRPAFSPQQRLLARCSRTQRLVFDGCFADWPPAAEALPAAHCERLKKPFALFVPGGGGYLVDGRPAAEIYVEAAERLHAASGIECLTLTGRAYAASAARARHTLALPEVSQTALGELMRRAQLTVTNGAPSLHHALACNAACVCAALGGGDQPARIAAYQRAGLIVAARPDPESLFQQAARLLDGPAREVLRAAAQHLRISNGLPLMAQRLDQLLYDRPGATEGLAKRM
jgi:hypothetical protein